MRVSGFVLGSPTPRALAEFYRQLLGWTLGADEPTWVTIRDPGGGTGLSFQLEEVYDRPVWPSRHDAQQMMAHLDIEVEDLDVAGAFAEQLGATRAEFQPQDDVRVYLDPDGHPFCFWIPT